LNTRLRGVVTDQPRSMAVLLMESAANKEGSVARCNRRGPYVRPPSMISRATRIRWIVSRHGKTPLRWKVTIPPAMFYCNRSPQRRNPRSTNSGPYSCPLQRWTCDSRPVYNVRQTLLATPKPAHLATQTGPCLCWLSVC
jgi:hypothetical protein